jgi:hypothetical protein
MAPSKDDNEVPRTLLLEENLTSHHLPQRCQLLNRPLHPLASSSDDEEVTSSVHFVHLQ